MFFKTKPCPRCLGKGSVDDADIKRLNAELLWLPGMCAYCEGKGVVGVRVNVAPETLYLNMDVPKRERRALRRGNRGALSRAEIYDQRSREFLIHMIQRLEELEGDHQALAQEHIEELKLHMKGKEPKEQDKVAVLEWCQQLSEYAGSKL
ncbi:hypothetical protein [Sanyastnella coralliicola]|uniref:hypothetical protein n=1 Tax=Sanyastnella coralliicola TaxID=3069118 RepID=UPI0027B9F81D|nr:hypothetical protein [Longitalea sp. SCSIO 12813]